jgi:hypothetical protein
MMARKDIDRHVDWLVSKPSAHERLSGRLIKKIASYPLLWRTSRTTVAGVTARTVKVSRLYFETLRAELTKCEELEYLARRGAREQGDLSDAQALDIYPELVAQQASRRLTASADQMASMAIARAGLAHAYVLGYQTGALHKFLARLSAERRQVESALTHAELAVLTFTDAGNDEGLSTAKKLREELVRRADEVSPTLSEIMSSLEGKYAARIDTNIQTVAAMGHVQLSHELAAEAVRRGLLRGELTTFLLGALHECARGDYDAAAQWLCDGEAAGGDPAVLGAAREALAGGLQAFVQAVEEVGLSWLAAGIDAQVLTAGVEAIERRDPVGARQVLTDPAVYFMPTLFPQLAELMAAAAPEAPARSQQYADAFAAWRDIGNGSRISLAQISRGDVERRLGRHATAAATTVDGILSLERIRRRNRLGATRRTVLAEMVTKVQESILDAQAYHGEPEAWGYSVPTPADYAAAVDAMRQDALALLIRQRSPVVPTKLGDELATLADMEAETLTSLDPSVVRSAIPVGTRRTDLLEGLREQDTRLLDVIFPPEPKPPVQHSAHQLIVDCEPRSDGSLGLFGVWIPPTDPDGPAAEVPYSVFAGRLGRRSRRLIGECKDPTVTTAADDLGPKRPKTPPTITDGEETAAALTEICDVLPSGFLETVAKADDAEVIVVPTGPLWGIPWAALPVSDHTMLIDHASVRVAPSTRLVTTAGPRAPKLRELTGFIDPDFMAGLPDLVDQLRNRCSVKMRALSDLTSHDGRDITLVMAHGQPERGLGHSVRHRDERLTAADIVTGCVGEVVLLLTCYGGACAYDRGIEPIALPTISLIRGARAVIAPLWAFPRQRMGQLAVDLVTHEHILDSPAQALRDVQRMHRRVDSDPSTWATLACFG